MEEIIAKSITRTEFDDITCNFHGLSWEFSQAIMSEKTVVVGTSGTAGEILGVLMHEIGHIRTYKKKYYRLESDEFLPAFNVKNILWRELRASGWALKWIKKNEVEYYKEARKTLKFCYGVYRSKYYSLIQEDLNNERTNN